jgi:hypothetical protein
VSDIELPLAHGSIPGYLAVPSDGGPWPAVVVLHEVFGLNDDIRRISDRFAANGYLAFAPALFSRGPKPLCIVSVFRSLATGKGSAVDDIVAVAESLRADDRTTGTVGSAGFCMGGGFCLLLADRGVFDATAPTYGPFPARHRSSVAVVPDRRQLRRRGPPPARCRSEARRGLVGQRRHPRHQGVSRGGPQLHERVEDAVCVPHRRTHCRRSSFVTAGRGRMAPDTGVLRRTAAVTLYAARFPAGSKLTARSTGEISASKIRGTYR